MTERKNTSAGFYGVFMCSRRFFKIYFALSFYTQYFLGMS